MGVRRRLYPVVRHHLETLLATAAEADHERLIPFSCEARGVCPSCNARRMGEVAAHLTDRVLPHVAARP